MFAGISHSLSGLAAAQTKINTAAHNIANANTAEFKKTRALSEESAVGGVQVTLNQVNTSGSVVLRDSDQGLSEQELSNVNLEEEVVNLLIGTRAFEVNLKALDLQDQALGSLLDIIE